MIFEISSTLGGLEIIGDGKQYQFKTKLFSHSSVLLDSSSNAVVFLTRSSWWRMNFDLEVRDRKYELRQRPLETELISSEPKIRFYTSGLDFYKGSSLVTNATRESIWSTKYKIKIHEKDHWLALLATTCLECTPVANDG